MRNDIAVLHNFEDFRQFDEIIDVRTSAEFSEDHIPGSINCPVLDNEQRIEVGTLYKQHSPFAARKIGAAYVAENIARHLRESFHDRPDDWKPLIVCWRGGQRSAAMTLVLRRVGWGARQLQGGYKDYRKGVVERLARLPSTLDFRVICGATGSGKSRLLQALGQIGEQVLDLEELACHKGSVLGILPGTAQPAQKMFETRVLSRLVDFDPQRPVYVEAESRRIGTIHLTDALLEALHRGTCLSIDASFDARVDFLLRDYAYFLADPASLDARLDALSGLQSRVTLARWHAWVGEQNWRCLVRELLELHYDPLYRRSQHRNFTGLSDPLVYATNDLSPTALTALARRIVESNAPD